MAYRLLLVETKLMQCKIAIKQFKTTQQKRLPTFIKGIHKNANSKTIHISQQEETTPMSIRSRMNKLWYTHRMGYNIAIKKLQVNCTNSGMWKIGDTKQLTFNMSLTAWLSLQVHFYSIVQWLCFLFRVIFLTWLKLLMAQWSQNRYTSFMVAGFKAKHHKSKSSFKLHSFLWPRPRSLWSTATYKASSESKKGCHKGVTTGR